MPDVQATIARNFLTVLTYIFTESHRTIVIQNLVFITQSLLQKEPLPYSWYLVNNIIRFFFLRFEVSKGRISLMKLESCTQWGQSHTLLLQQAWWAAAGRSGRKTIAWGYSSMPQLLKTVVLQAVSPEKSNHNFRSRDSPLPPPSSWLPVNIAPQVVPLCSQD